MRGVCVRLGRNRQRPGKSVETVEVHRDSVHYTPLSVMLVCMCGIVGYAGDVNCPSMRALEVCLQGLERLEYRGYDSAGVALTAPGMDRVAVRKKAGRLSNLVEDIEVRPLPDATVAIGHTRWATNGVPNDVNAHPHASRDGKVAIIHNGIIENASQLRLDLQAEGYRFVSGTDTEVAAKLLGKIVDAVLAETGDPDLFEAMRRLGRMLEGAFTILAVDCRQPGEIGRASCRERV